MFGMKFVSPRRFGEVHDQNHTVNSEVPALPVVYLYSQVQGAQVLEALMHICPILGVLLTSQNQDLMQEVPSGTLYRRSIN